MKEPWELATTRRELLRRCLRAAVAGGIAAGSLALVFRSGTTCPGTVACRQCNRLAGCGLPGAVEARKDAEAQPPLRQKGES